MKYTRKHFTVPLGGEKFGEGWDRIFGKKEEPKILHSCPDRASHCTCADRFCCFCGQPKAEPVK